MDLSASYALRGYSEGRPATAAHGEQKSTSFQSALASLGTDFSETLAKAETAAVDAMSGSGSSHALVTALAQSQLAVEAAVTVRNKVVEAYQEILRMPV